MNTRPISSRTYRRAADACYAQGKVNDTPCWRCGYAIDYNAPRGRTPNSFTAGHPIERDRGGHLTEGLLPEHALCNYQAGAVYRNRKRTTMNITTSRDW